MNTKIISWVFQLIVVYLIGQTLFYKFTDDPETVKLFGQLGMGPFGYKLIGLLELVTCILLLIPASIATGALLGWGLMTGAIIAHVTEIGFKNGNGVLGSTAILAWLLCAAIMYLNRTSLPVLSAVFKKDKSELNS